MSSGQGLYLQPLSIGLVEFVGKHSPSLQYGLSSGQGLYSFLYLQPLSTGLVEFVGKHLPSLQYGLSSGQGLYNFLYLQP